jgi:hypothetical protein
MRHLIVECRNWMCSATKQERNNENNRQI